MNLNMSALTHTPVLLEEAVRALAVQPGGRYIDCTLGGGGHALSILEKSSPGGQLLGIDGDPKAIEAATTRLKGYTDSVRLVKDNFINLQNICFKYDFLPVHGILLDLGLSSMQLAEDDYRGFSFQHESPLDMRMNPDQHITAADIINRSSEAELANILRTYGEEPRSRQIARQIVKVRPIETTLKLAKTVERACGGRREKIHPATKTFQALRIAVNHELENLESTLKQAVNLLGFGGRLVVISYHSLEDRIVKQFMQRESRDCICPPATPSCICGHTASLRLINKKVITPSAQEIKLNPRSRSAKLRAAERIFPQEDYREATEGLCLAIKNSENGWRRPVMLERLRTTFWAS